MFYSVVFEVYRIVPLLFNKNKKDEKRDRSVDWKSQDIFVTFSMPQHFKIKLFLDSCYFTVINLFFKNMCFYVRCAVSEGIV